MQIVSIKYADEGQSGIVVTLDDGRVLSAPWPVQSWHREIIQEWLDAGGAISPADPPPDPPDLADVDNAERALKALGLVVARWAGKSVLDLRAAFREAYNQLG